MKRFWLSCAVLLLLATSACKETYWTFVSRGGGEIARADQPANVPPPPVNPPAPEPAPAKPEPATPAQPVTPKDIIYVLGIDGMD